MVSISTKFNDAIANAQLRAAANDVSEGIKEAGRILASPDKQRKVFADIRTGVDSIFTTISTVTNKANKTMETKGEATLHSSIKAMKEYKATPVVIKESDSTNATAAKKVVNSLKTFHEKVIVQGENISQKAGDKAHSLTNAILYPIRFIAKFAQVEVAGALIQNSIALAVGFAVRGIVLALSQLAHIAPYAIAAGVVGGIGVGLAALAVHVSPLAAALAGVGLVMIGQQAQIAVLSRDVNKLANAILENKQKAANSTIGANAKKLASILAKGITVPAGLIYKHKGKVATAAIISGAAAYAHVYGVPAFATEAYNFVSNYVANFFNSSNINGFSPASPLVDAANQFEAAKDAKGAMCPGPMNGYLPLSS